LIFVLNHNQHDILQNATNNNPMDSTQIAGQEYLVEDKNEIRNSDTQT
jgi:hypothetical protein